MTIRTIFAAIAIAASFNVQADEFWNPPVNVIPESIKQEFISKRDAALSVFEKTTDQCVDAVIALNADTLLRTQIPACNLRNKIWLDTFLAVYKNQVTYIAEQQCDWSTEDQEDWSDECYSLHESKYGIDDAINRFETANDVFYAATDAVND